LGTQETERRQRDNQEWTIKRHWHYWAHKTHDEDKGTIKNGQSRDTDTIGHTRHMTKTKGRSRMDNQETLTLFGTQDTWRGQRDDQEWAIKRHWHYLDTEVTGQRQRCNQELKKTFASCENKSGIAPF
jgi:hypothetical protein